MPKQTFLNRQTSRKLFLIDAIGALVSTMMLGVVLIRLESLIGMPPDILYLLAGIAALFFINSSTCYLRNIQNWKPYLKIVAVANLIYCCLTAVLVIALYDMLTFLGIAYFIGEIVLVVMLSTFELRYAAQEHTAH